MHDDTATVPTPTHARTLPRGLLGRVAMWWTATTEIAELTRDREREDRVRAEAAVRLAPGPWAIADLFRRR
ncbi:hypothetical protein [Curtobacterium sp. VKM Ac-2922]|uniref:hypothetical protein n=1 Tax=Curtobacterium sp. VKM Ac-2922 TaxID=2929475 RepID=UPI001FB1FD92|nr:hypothetical protein [Curtobacterium sp. VKM Ac-2922]MCJ1715253.1 hypothetical protein [Curtobacterium sp. VKM Ac-2922]